MSKKDIQEMLVSMGFQPNYIGRAFKVYEKNYGQSYNVEVITEIIVRLQNKDKAKKDKGKSPQPPNKQSSNDQAKPSSNNSSPSKSKQKSPAKESPSKPPKPAKHAQPAQPASPQQVNISSNSNMNKQRMSGKPQMNHNNMNNVHNNNNMKHSQNYNNNGSMNGSNNNLPGIGGMSRSQSGGHRKKQKPGPPPNNPLPNGQNASYGNNQQSPPKMNTHSKSQTVMSSQFVPPAPNRYTENEIVLYNNQQAQIKQIINPNKIIITYPASVYILQRQQATVSPQQIQKLNKGSGPAPPQRQSSQPRQQQQGYIQHNNNNPSNHNPQSSGHQYSRSQSNYAQYPNPNNLPNQPRPPQRQNQPRPPQQRSTQPPSQHHMAMSQSPQPPMKPNKNNHPPKNKNVSNNNSPQKPVKHKKPTPTKDAAIPPFESHMNIQQAMRLKVHDKIDHRDQVGRFVYATVSEKQGSNLKIHYDGWSRKWDTWSDFNKEIHRFAAAGSISKRPAHRFKTLKKGDYVDINPTQRHPGWKCGEIRRLDQKSGQVQVVYECADKNYLYWAHLDNMQEIAEFTSKSGTVHATQVDMLNNQGQGAKGGQQGQQQWHGQQGQGAMAMKNNMQQKSMQQQPNFGGYPQQGQQGGYGGYNAMQQGQAAVAAAPMDELEAFERIRAKRFPLYQGEKVENPYSVGDWLEVQDTQTLQWITATVIDKHNNWIVVHFDGWPSKYDQKIHAVRNKKRLRALGSGLQETQEEKDIKEEMANFLKEVEELHWKLEEVDADGNCLYRCFATEIYGDTNKHRMVRDECCKYMRQNQEFFQNFIPDFESRMKEKEQEYEWGDHVDITALSELYNVRVRVFEYDSNQNKLYMSFDQGEHADTVNLPLVLLARHRRKHYNILTDPNSPDKRPLKAPEKRKNIGISLRELRLREDAKTEHKDDEKEADNEEVGGGDDGGNVNLRKNVSRHNSYHSAVQSPHGGYGGFMNFDSRQFEIYLDEKIFTEVLATWNISEPLEANDLKNIFAPLLKKTKAKLEHQWNSNHAQIDKNILSRFWHQQFEQKQQASQNCKRWLQSLREKVPSGKYNISTALNSWNQTIGSSIADNLGHIVATRKRESTIDVHRSYQFKQSQQQQNNNKMDVDK